MLHNRFMIRVVCLALSLAPIAAPWPALATDHYWNRSSGGSFNSSSNWSPSGPPGLGDTAFFALSPTYTVSFSASPTNTYMEQHDGNVTFDLNGRTYTAVYAYLAKSSGHSSQLTVTDGTVSVAVTSLGNAGTANGALTVSTGGTWSTFAGARLYVGEGGTGTLTIQNGGAVSVDSSSYIGESAGSNGTATVNGTGSTWDSRNLYVGTGGTGTLTIENGGEVSSTYGYVGSGSASNGAVTVDGTGSKWTTPNELGIAYEGTGTLDVQNGGTVTSNGGYIAGRSGSTGTVTLTGSGSTWTNTGSLDVGGSRFSLNAGGSGSLYVNNNGELHVTDTMKIWSTGSVEVTGGTISAGAIENAGTLLNNGAVSGNVLNQSGGTLSGSGTFQDTVTIADGSTVSPGASPGTMTWGSGVLEGGGSLLWEINDATGSAGANWDLLSVDNTLGITATALDPFVIDIDSLLPDNSPGLLDNFSNTGSYQWTISTAAGGITGFSPDYFQLDDTGFQNDLGGEDFYLTLAGNNLNLNFGTAVPEPSTFVLWGSGAITLILLGRRRLTHAGS